MKWHVLVKNNKTGVEFVKDFDSPYKKHLFINKCKHGTKLTYIRWWCDDPYVTDDYDE